MKAGRADGVDVGRVSKAGSASCSKHARNPSGIRRPSVSQLSFSPSAPCMGQSSSLQCAQENTTVNVFSFRDRLSASRYRKHILTSSTRVAAGFTYQNSKAFLCSQAFRRISLREGSRELDIQGSGRAAVSLQPALFRSQHCSQLCGLFFSEVRHESSGRQRCISAAHGHQCSAQSLRLRELAGRAG